VDRMSMLWGGAAIVFLIMEGVTAGLTSIWFAIGAAAALVCALLGLPVWVQVLVFAVVSAAALLLTRPLAKKYVNSKRQPTNADRTIGATGRVTETIDNVAATGSVTVGGKLWTARSVTGAVIPEGTLVRCTGIEGVKLMVVPEMAKEMENV
jgi:membrane protein implicated in regulation of membrane protease activity